jgi:hypothetical protein
MNDSIDEFSKPRKTRKQKTHYQRQFFDDDVEEVHNRKQAGKKNHSRFMYTPEVDIEEDDPYYDQYVKFLK